MVTVALSRASGSLGTDYALKLHSANTESAEDHCIPRRGQTWASIHSVCHSFTQQTLTKHLLVSGARYTVMNKMIGKVSHSDKRMF